MNNITIFNFNQNQVRTQTINDEPWFCLIDTCDALSIKQCRIDRLSGNGLIKNQLTDNLGRLQETYFINEPNLYRLIFRSNKPQAQAFADWVYSEVLPSIRKTGSYRAQTLDVKSLAEAVAQELKKQQVLALPKPKPIVPDIISNFVSDAVSVSDDVTPFADIYQMFDLWCFSHDRSTLSSNRLSRYLQALGYEKTTDRKGHKGFRLGLKQYDRTRYRYGFTPVSKFCGSGIYKMNNGECYQIIKALDGNLLYTWYNLRTGQAEGPQSTTVPETFEHHLRGKITSRAEILPLNGNSEFIGFAD